MVNDQKHTFPHKTNHMNQSNKYIIMFLAFLLPGVLLAQQTNSRNYIISCIYKQSGADPNDVSKVVTQVQYLDGLGRPLQNVTVGQSPSGSDFVQPIEFDAAGRQSKQFLPYVATGNGAYQSNGVTNAATWYTTNSAGLQATDLASPFTETFFEPSPTSRASGQKAPGAKSANSNIKYKTNCCGELKRYDYDIPTNVISQPGGYAPGTITYIQTTDEEGKTVMEYTDLLGRTVCRQVVAVPGAGPGAVILSTYYVYDDIGLLRAVLQPQYQDQASLTDYAFTYDYDEFGRVAIKRTPGGGITELVYDQFDRLVASRDANQFARGVWSFTKYDAQNRPVVTGEIASNATRTVWATNVAAIAEHHEERSNGTTAGYTLDKTAPLNATEANLLTITFYDDYGFSKAVNLAYNALYYPSYNANVKGQITGSRVRMLPGNGAAGGWLTSVTYYDGEYRPIQTDRELYDLGAGAIERSSTQYKYDLAPVIDIQTTVHLFPGNFDTGYEISFQHDHADRVLKAVETVDFDNDIIEVNTSAYRYNAVGQLQNKWFHSMDGVNYLRKTDYTHNIRGWLTDGKTVYKKAVGDPPLPFFGFGLSYANGANYTNGNISQMQWQNKDEAAFTKGLSFSYDGANRLLGSSGLNGYVETENGLTYDKNGNIKTLVRGGAVLDNLNYTYLGNRLSTVNDASGSNLGVKSGASSYGYDGNGNMTNDGNRGATLTYNYLNLPKTVTMAGKTFIYDYDAAGSKHKYVTDTMTVKYAGGFEYRQVGAANQLFRFSLQEGQAVLRGNKVSFEYFLKDHLGNVRVVFNAKGETLQRTDYYPFGLEIDKNNPIQPQNARNGINRYLYNGKEFQVGTGYLDFGARMYDPLIGRMTTVDRFTEKYVNVSGFQFALNNPISNIDVNGDSAWKITNQWNSSFIKQFAKELPSYIQKFAAGKDKYTCDDLGLSVAMEFAKDNQLPFHWETESKSFDAASEEYSDFSTFSHDVKATSGAPDFQNSENTVSVNPKDANTGSILLNAMKSNGRAHHVQMVMGRSNDGNSLLIKQGNFNSLGRILGSDDPSSMRYLGIGIQTGTYNQKTDTWRNITNGTAKKNFSSEERLIYKAYNFINWNK
jgi:RHS repeat-associated protein